MILSRYLSIVICTLFIGMSMQSCAQKEAVQNDMEKSFTNAEGKEIEKVFMSEAEWKAELNDLEFKVLRKQGTERAFTGDLWDNKKEGKYTCRGCGLELFDSATKYKSGSGWPSFYEPVDKSHVLEVSDVKFGMKRTEIVCHKCGGHLGHVFNDGPKPTGLRYCMNSASLDFAPNKP